MRNSLLARWLVLVSIALAEAALARTPAAARRRVAELASGETLRVRYVSAGSFHLQERLILIEGGRNKRAFVSPPTRESVGLPLDVGGVVWLDGFDVARFDHLLAFYRSNRPVGCAIKEEIILTWMKGGEPAAIERFSDESCLARDVPAFLSLRELVLRAGVQLR